MARLNRRQKSRYRRVRSRRFQIQILERRTVLSGIALTDVDTHDQDQSHSPGCSCGLCVARFDANGLEYYALPVAGASASSSASSSGSGSLDGTTLADTFKLHSNPGAKHTIFLDFDGATTSGTSWNSFNGGADIVTPAYSFTGDSTFADSELARIQAIWQRVAEDFIPFDVNVTTQEPAADALIKSGSNDTAWGVRVVIGGNGSWYGNAGGVAYIGSFNWSSDTPVFVFEDNLGNGHEKYTAEAITHEAGHALGLGHDGRTSPSEAYYQGHGSGATGWAPIMGVGYYKELTQWSKGEYAYANNTQDDLAIITGNNGFGYRADDYGDSIADSSALTVDQGTVVQSGIIERTDDFDVFTFLTGAGNVTFNVTPFERGPNLDIAAALLDATGSVIVSANPSGTLSASLSATLAAGQYFVQITGGGQGDPLNGGYSDYSSLGAYTINGSIVQTNAAYLSLSAANADQNEGNSGSMVFTFTVTRSGDTSIASSVDWAVSSDAADGSDFVGGALPTGVVTFAAGETSKTISFEVSGDLDSESDELFSVVLSNASEGTLIATSSASGVIRNDDAAPTPPGITVTPVSGLTTTEMGGTATFTIVLNSAPTADVVIQLASSDLTEGTINRSSLTFTPDNWSTAQIVTITGVDDTVRDRNVQYTIRTAAAQSADADYQGLNADDVQVTNQDNEKGKGGGAGSGGGGKGKKAAVVQDGIAQVPTQVRDQLARKSNAVEEVRGESDLQQFDRSADFSALDRLFSHWNDDSQGGSEEGSSSMLAELGCDQLDELWAEFGINK